MAPVLGVGLGPPSGQGSDVGRRVVPSPSPAYMYTAAHFDTSEPHIEFHALELSTTSNSVVPSSSTFHLQPSSSSGPSTSFHDEPNLPVSRQESRELVAHK